MKCEIVLLTVKNQVHLHFFKGMNLFLQMWFRIVISECSASFVVVVVAVVGGDGDCVVAFHNCNSRVTQQGIERSVRPALGGFQGDV